jgi:hypothetical protein
MKRIMYIERKDQDGLDGPGRIGWVELSRSRRAYLYGERRLQKVVGFKHNCVDAETGDMFWVSGPKKNGEDKLYGGVVEIDEDAREEYWKKVRGLPERVTDRSYRS